MLTAQLRLRAFLACAFICCSTVTVNSGQHIELTGVHTIRIRLWDASEEGIARLLATYPGRQSRDLGWRLREEADRCGISIAEVRCLVRPHAGAYRFEIEFRYIRFDRLPGGVVRHNDLARPVPTGFGRWRNRLEVVVEGGQGKLMIPADWVTTESVICIHSPWGRGQLYYPPSGVLCTLPPSQSEDGIGEFYRLIREEATEDQMSNYHFAK